MTPGNLFRHVAVLAELLGTFFLTLAALLAGTPYAVGLTLAAFVYAIGGISGCNLNPAVTLGLVAARRLPVAKGALYVFAQLAGALVAAFTSFLVGNPLPNYESATIAGEFFGFGFLILTVMAVSDKYVPTSGSGIAIGAALAAGLLTTNGILNPAVAIAMSETLSPATWATLLSGIVFALLFALIAPGEQAKQAHDKEQEAEEPSRGRQHPSWRRGEARAEDGASD